MFVCLPFWSSFIIKKKFYIRKRRSASFISSINKTTYTRIYGTIILGLYLKQYHIISWLFTIIIPLKFILNCGWIYVGWLAYDLIWSYPLLMFSNKLSYICLCCNFNFTNGWQVLVSFVENLVEILLTNFMLLCCFVQLV